jgi:hypothetical protein
LLSLKHISPVALYDANRFYILTFKNKKQLSDFVGCGISTLTRCLASGDLLKGALPEILLQKKSLSIA